MNNRLLAALWMTLALSIAAPSSRAADKPAADKPAAEKTAAATRPAADGPLFNGKDLTGWTVTNKKTPPESVDGKTEAAGGRFKVDAGELVIDPKVKGDIVLATAKEVAGDTTIRFEFKPGPKCNNDLLYRGTKFDLKAQDVPNLKQDEWNRFEIVAVGNEVEFRNNGESIKKVKAKAAAGTLGLRAEAGPIRYRNIVVSAK